MAQPQRSEGFDMNRVTTGQKILLAAGLLYLISLFLPWAGVSGIDLGAFGDFPGVTVSGWAGIFGTLSGLLVIALLVWEGLIAAGVNINLGTTSPALIGAIIGAAAALFGIINFLTSLGGIQWGAFLGLIFALGLGYGAFVRFNESKIA